MIDLGLTVLGIGLLLAGGTALVKGASELAAGYGVSPLVVGLTVVAFGTSTPELVVNVLGATGGETEIAFGNVVGSNISNLALVLGAAALMHPIRIQSQIIRRELPLLLLATAVITVMALDGPLEGDASVIGRSDSIVLFLLFGIFIYISVLDLLRAKPGDALFAELDQHRIPAAEFRQWLQVIYIAAGIGLLYVGGDLTVTRGSAFATSVGVSPAIVGLFLVAIGTSLPELITSIIAAFRDEPDLALGNVIGSNLFNSLAVLPASGVIARIPVDIHGIVDLLVSLALAAVLVPVFLVGSGILGRTSGVLLLLSYFGYAAYRIGTT